MADQPLHELREQEYYQRHKNLHTAWWRFFHVFEVLPPATFHAVCMTYRPWQLLNEQEFKAMRQKAVAARGQRTSIAGKGYALIESAFRAGIKDSEGNIDRFNQNVDAYLAQRLSRRQPSSPLEGVRIRSEQREQIDWDLFAWALLTYCRRKAARKVE